MKRVFIAIAVTIISGCSQIRAQQMQTANINTLQAINDCAKRQETGEFKNFTETALCQNAAMLKIQQEGGNPDMDLVQWLASENLTVSQKIDAKEMTQEQGDAHIGEIMAKIQEITAQRNTQRQEARSAAALMMLQAMQNASRSYTQPPPAPAPAFNPGTHCTTHVYGNQASTDCY